MHRDIKVGEELRTLPVWATIAIFFAYAVRVWPTYSSTSAQRLLSIVGPDLVVLDIVNRLAPVVLVTSFLLAWWRVTSTQESQGCSYSQLIGLCVSLTIILGTVISAIALTAVGINARSAGLPSLFLLPVLLAVTGFYVGTCITLGAATGVLTTRSVIGRLVTMTILLGIVFFQIIVNAVYNLVTDRPLDLFNQPADPALFFFHRFSPFRAYNVLTNWIYGIGNSSSRTRITVRQLQPATDGLVTNSFVAEHTFAEGVPWYLSEWVAIVILGLWFGVSVVVLYLFTDSVSTS